MKISIPKLSFVVLIGASGSGKSTFAKSTFLAAKFCLQIIAADWLATTKTIKLRIAMLSTFCTTLPASD